jgi:hypothetical protein
MALVPTLASALLPLLQQNMPHKVRDRDTQCTYLRALLHLAEAPAGLPIREALLVGVVEHLLTIDVEIRWQDIVDVPTGAPRLLPRCFTWLMALGLCGQRWTCCMQADVDVDPSACTTAPACPRPCAGSMVHCKCAAGAATCFCMWRACWY